MNSWCVIVIAVAFALWALTTALSGPGSSYSIHGEKKGGKKGGK